MELFVKLSFCNQVWPQIFATIYFINVTMYGQRKSWAILNRCHNILNMFSQIELNVAWICFSTWPKVGSRINWDNFILHSSLWILKWNLKLSIKMSYLDLTLNSISSLVYALLSIIFIFLILSSMIKDFECLKREEVIRMNTLILGRTYFADYGQTVFVDRVE